MRTVALISRGAVLAIGVGLAACTTSAAPEPSGPVLWRTYVLTHVDSQPLPAAYLQLGGTAYTAVAETLWFYRDTIVAIRGLQLRSIASGPPTQVPLNGTTRYTRTGDSLTVGVQIVCVTIPCPDSRRRGRYTDSTAALVLFDSIAFQYRRVLP